MYIITYLDSTYETQRKIELLALSNLFNLSCVIQMLLTEISPYLLYMESI